MSDFTTSAAPAATPAPTPAYYAIIPAHVRYDDSLPPNAKLLYGEITALCSMEGFCWAKNAYFAKLDGVKVRAVQRWIEALEAAGHILVEPIDGYQRHIRLPEAERAARVRKEAIEAPVKKDMGACQKRHTPVSLKTRPHVNKDTHSITESITKKNTKNPEDLPLALSEKTQPKIPDSNGSGGAASDPLAGLSAAEYKALEQQAREKVIAETGPPICDLARRGKATRDVKARMREMLTQEPGPLPSNLSLPSPEISP